MLIGVHKEYSNKINKTGIDFSDLPEDVVRNTEKFMDDKNIFSKLLTKYIRRNTNKNKDDLKLKSVWDKIKYDEEYKSSTKTKKQKDQYNYNALQTFLKNKYGQECIEKDKSSGVLILKDFHLLNDGEENNEDGDGDTTKTELIVDDDDDDDDSDESTDGDNNSEN